ncbi:MAG: iron ABC transporter permease [Spirochaetaceae bacterium]|jgi:thiamine transport system permease protein|nr:iron ABC transporter permease [Spirochaetaceae bacterium]
MNRSRISSRLSGGAVWPLLFAGLPLIIVALAFFIPYIDALSLSFRSDPLAGGAAPFPPRLFKILGFTLWQACISTAFALLVGLPGAYIISSRHFRYKKFARVLSAVPFALPPIVMVLGFVLFWGNSGFINRTLSIFFGEGAEIRILYKPGALIFANTCYNFPLVMRLAGDAFLKIRENYEESALSLGASPLKTALTVALPLSMPSIISAALLVFLYCWTAFALPLVLGGGPGTTPLAVEIYRYAHTTLNYKNAGIFALAETAVSALAFTVYLFFDKKSYRMTGHFGNSETITARVKTACRKTGKRLQRAGTRFTSTDFIKTVYLTLILVIVLGPLLSVFADSFLAPTGHGSSAGFSLKNWIHVDVRILSALGRSLILASVSATISCILALMMAKSGDSPVSRFTAIAPAVSSGIVTGLGFLSFYGQNSARSFIALSVMHAVTALPFTFNSIYTGLRSIPQNTLNASELFGAGYLKKLFVIEIPLCSRNIRSAWGFAACISIGEVNLILMLGMEQWETLPLYIYRAVSAYRYDMASAAGTILIGASLLALFLSEHDMPVWHNTKSNRNKT